jgi:hypothetical protein
LVVVGDEPARMVADVGSTIFVSVMVGEDPGGGELVDTETGGGTSLLVEKPGGGLFDTETGGGTSLLVEKPGGGLFDTETGGGTSLRVGITDEPGGGLFGTETGGGTSLLVGVKSGGEGLVIVGGVMSESTEDMNEDAAPIIDVKGLDGGVRSGGEGLVVVGGGGGMI